MLTQDLPVQSTLIAGRRNATFHALLAKGKPRPRKRGVEARDENRKSDRETVVYSVNDLKGPWEDIRLSAAGGVFETR